MPTPYELVAAASRSRSASVISRSSSLATRPPTVESVGVTELPDASANFVLRSTASGLKRQVRKVQRRTRAEIGPGLSIDDDDRITSNDKLNYKNADNLFIVELCNRHAWPSGDEKMTMVNEAITQTNYRARADQHEETAATKDLTDHVGALVVYTLMHTYSFQVKHAGTNWRSKFKTFVVDHIHFWDIAPSSDQQAKMTPAEVVEFIARKVAEALADDGFLHFGVDALVSNLVLHADFGCRPFVLQGHHAWFNHPSFHHLLVMWFFGPNGIARLFPHRFGPLFPIPCMALGATMVR